MLSNAVDTSSKIRAVGIFLAKYSNIHSSIQLTAKCNV